MMYFNVYINRLYDENKAKNKTKHNNNNNNNKTEQNRKYFFHNIMYYNLQCISVKLISTLTLIG